MARKAFMVRLVVEVDCSHTNTLKGAVAPRQTLRIYRRKPCISCLGGDPAGGSRTSPHRFLHMSPARPSPQNQSCPQISAPPKCPVAITAPAVNTARGSRNRYSLGDLVSHRLVSHTRIAPTTAATPNQRCHSNVPRWSDRTDSLAASSQPVAAATTAKAAPQPNSQCDVAFRNGVSRTRRAPSTKPPSTSSVNGTCRTIGCSRPRNSSGAMAPFAALARLSGVFRATVRQTRLSAVVAADIFPGLSENPSRNLCSKT